MNGVGAFVSFIRQQSLARHLLILVVEFAGGRESFDAQRIQFIQFMHICKQLGSIKLFRE